MQLVNSGYVVWVNRGTVSGSHPSRRVEILDSDGQSVQKPHRFASGQGPIGGFSRASREGFIQGTNGVDVWIYS